MALGCRPSFSKVTWLSVLKSIVVTLSSSLAQHSLPDGSTGINDGIQGLAPEALMLPDWLRTKPNRQKCLSV